MTAVDAADDAELWNAVGEPSRRLVLDLLLDQGEATATTLATGLPFSRQAVTKHLAVLERVGLVEGRRHGRELRYSVRPDRLDQATEAMAEQAARWDARLRRIKERAEAAHRDGPGPDRTGSDGGR